MTSVKYDHNGIYNLPKIIGYIPNQIELRKHGTSFVILQRRYGILSIDIDRHKHTSAF